MYDSHFVIFIQSFNSLTLLRAYDRLCVKYVKIESTKICTYIYIEVYDDK